MTVGSVIPSVVGGISLRFRHHFATAELVRASLGYLTRWGFFTALKDQEAELFFRGNAWHIRREN